MKSVGSNPLCLGVRPLRFHHFIRKWLISPLEWPDKDSALMQEESKFKQPSMFWCLTYQSSCMFIRQLYQEILLFHSPIPIKIGWGGGGLGRGQGGEQHSLLITDSKDSMLLLKDGWRDEVERERKQTIYSHIAIKSSAPTGGSVIKAVCLRACMFLDVAVYLCTHMWLWFCALSTFACICKVVLVCACVRACVCVHLCTGAINNTPTPQNAPLKKERQM